MSQEKYKVQRESAESSTVDLDMNYGKLYHHTLACAVSFCQPTMSSSSRAAVRHLVDSRLPHLPSERAKGQQGSAEAQPLPTSPSVNPSCLHHVGPESGISSTVDVPILPRKEKRARGVCLQILCLPTLTSTTGNPSMINTDRIPIEYQ